MSSFRISSRAGHRDFRLHYPDGRDLKTNPTVSVRHDKEIVATSCKLTGRVIEDYSCDPAGMA
jgi:hypothetical protein